MATGIAAATANGWIDGLTGLYCKLHTGDPGAAGAANASAEATRKSFAKGTASGGSATQTGSASWTWATGTETISHVSYWTAVTGGTFVGSFALASAKPMTNGDTLNLSGCTIAVTGLAA